MIGALLWAAAAAAPVHPPEIEKHLAPLVGEWTRAGKEASYRDSCVWFDRRSFVVCSLTDIDSGVRVNAIVGYSKERERFTYQNYSNDGGSRVEYGFALGDTGLVFTDERSIAGKATRLTTRMERQPDGRLQITQDRSTMGAPWQQVAQVYYVPRR